MKRLIWLCPKALESALDAATWLDTTRELRQMDWDVTLVCAGSRDGPQDIRGIEVLCLAIPDFYFLRHVVFHARFLSLLGRTPGADVLLFNPVSLLWILPIRLSRILSRRQRPLCVMDTRSLHMPTRNRQGWKGYAKELHEKVMKALSIRGTDGHTAITESMATSMGVPPGRLWGTWPSGVDIERFAACSSQREWPRPGEAIRLGYLGALEYERNLLSLALAVQAGNADGMAFEFALVGDGPQRSELEALARRSSGVVRVFPSISYGEVPGFLTGIHVGSSPFPDEEKFRVSSPIKLFEYMAASLPILVTRIPAHVDVIKDGKYAFWAEESDVNGLLDALRLVWRERLRLKESGASALTAARAWTWHASALKLKSALEDGLERFGHAPLAR